ncbi:hypothetical protein D7322_07710 [Sphingobacterium puteale]|uniref:Uncharacterized protein n=1 Tax=Sphingobacterium puteale TaxID=2420510 RepID=A0A420W0C8_9SPHI|nr:hypothetical protein D7322_07710 [Sphingobacterium puteale]
MNAKINSCDKYFFGRWNKFLYSGKNTWSKSFFAANTPYYTDYTFENYGYVINTVFWVQLLSYERKKI